MLCVAWSSDGHGSSIVRVDCHSTAMACLHALATQLGRAGTAALSGSGTAATTAQCACKHDSGGSRAGGGAEGWLARQAKGLTSTLSGRLPRTRSRALPWREDHTLTESCAGRGAGCGSGLRRVCTRKDIRRSDGDARERVGRRVGDVSGDAMGDAMGGVRIGAPYGHVRTAQAAGASDAQRPEAHWPRCAGRDAVPGCFLDTARSRSCLQPCALWHSGIESPD